METKKDEKKLEKKAKRGVSNKRSKGKGANKNKMKLSL